jgi:hypothetical protein
VLIVLAGEGVFATQEGTADTAADGVVERTEIGDRPRFPIKVIRDRSEWHLLNANVLI